MIAHLDLLRVCCLRLLHLDDVDHLAHHDLRQLAADLKKLVEVKFNNNRNLIIIKTSIRAYYFIRVSKMYIFKFTLTQF
jgi:hypothetical protein